MKVRIKFSKSGAMKFIGHLDMMRYFQKAIRRADIDIAYSGGFSPHQIMSFAAPLGVGLTSNGEYFDIELYSLRSTEDLQSRLNQTMVEGVSILAVNILSEKAGNAMASVAAAAYTVRFREDIGLPTDWVSRFKEFFHSPTIPFTKKTKKSVIELDLKPLIYQMEVKEESIFMLVNASSSGNIKPDYVITAFCDSIGLQLPEFALLITREETYGNKGGENMILVPLSDLT